MNNECRNGIGSEIALTKIVVKKFFRVSIINFLQWCLNGVRKRILREPSARSWSNIILKKYLKYFSGDIIYVSGWEDADKEGGFYRDYYASFTRYVVSNIDGTSGMSEKVPEEIESIYLDLGKPIKPDLHKKFDVVFTHTVLEHIYKTEQALQNIVDMSRDMVVTVVPFSQGVHYTDFFSDYIRLTPFYLKKFFKERGFTVLLSSANQGSYTSIYLVFIASLQPEKYKNFFKNAPIFYDLCVQPGRWGKSPRQCTKK